MCDRTRLVIDVLARLGQDKPAALLLGALWASRSASPVYGADAARLAVAETELCARRGETAYDAAIAEGAGLDGNEAMALAGRTVADLVKETPQSTPKIWPISGRIRSTELSGG